MTKTTNVSVSNVYKDPTYKSEIVSQALLGENVEVLKSENEFDFVRQSDGYEGWVKNNQLVESDQTIDAQKIITAHSAQIYSEMSDTSIPIRNVVMGCKLKILCKKADWFQVQLPDHHNGWLKQKNLGEFPKLNRENVVKLAQQFLGYPYFWGGRSTRGFDCSGFSQTVFGLLGYQLPRDSYMQKDSTRKVSMDITEATAGDLLFFGDDKIKVDHVGIALGKSKIIHSRGMVKINSMHESAKDFDAKLKETLITVNTVF